MNTGEVILGLNWIEFFFFNTIRGSFFSNKKNRFYFPTFTRKWIIMSPLYIFNFLKKRSCSWMYQVCPTSSFISWCWVQFVCLVSCSLNKFPVSLFAKCLLMTSIALYFQYLENELGIENLRTMRRIKDALDPNNIMNPGKLIPPLICF